jgi:methyl-accepting chemotaxis protein
MNPASGPSASDYDKTFLILLLAHLPVTALLAPIGYGTHSFAIAASLLNGVFIIVAYLLTRQTRLFRVLSVIALMTYSAILIQAQLGRLEMHFHIFVALALMLLYRDWLVPVVGAGLIAVHHVVLTVLQLSEVTLGGMPVMIYASECSWSVTFLHALFVVLETVGLVYFARIMAIEKRSDEQLRGMIHTMVADRNLVVSVEGDSVTMQQAIELADTFNRLIGFLQRENARLVEHTSDLVATFERAGQYFGQAAGADPRLQDRLSRLLRGAVTSATLSG